MIRVLCNNVNESEELNESTKSVPVKELAKLIDEMEKIKSKLRNVSGYSTNYEEALRDAKSSEGYGSLSIRRIVVCDVLGDDTVSVRRIDRVYGKTNSITERVSMKTLMKYNKTYDQVKKELENISGINYDNHQNPDLYDEKGISKFNSRYKDKKAYLSEMIKKLDEIDNM